MTHPGEPHGPGLSGRLNWLRAGVLGANDGIVSVAAITVGVAAVTNQLAPVLTAGLAALVGGMVSMALGEYVSVSSQRDSQRALIAKERQELATMPEAELAELTQLYRDKGLSETTARTVAEELTAHDVLAAHLDAELGIDADEIVSPWSAAFASAVSFLVGGVLPLAVIFLPTSVRIWVSFAVVLVALAVTGLLGARLGGSPLLRASTRVVVGGALALAATFLIGRLLGVAGIG